jgi:hypothetical protein
MKLEQLRFTRWLPPWLVTHTSRSPSRHRCDQRPPHPSKNPRAMPRGSVGQPQGLAVQKQKGRNWVRQAA